VLAAVTTVAGGDASVVHANGFDVQTRSRDAVEAPVLEGSSLGKEHGEATFTWTCPTARNGYVVQTASDRKDAATYSHVIPCTRKKMTLRGLASGSSLYARIAAIDPASTNGLGPWCEWFRITAR
jgi:hypothetical protein